MLWYLGVLLGYALIAGLITKANPHLSSPAVWLLLAGFFLANFIGVGLGMRDRRDSVRSGVASGLLLGGHWLAYMGLVAAAGAIFAGIVIYGSD